MISVTIGYRNSAVRLLYTAVSTTIIAHIVIMARSFALWLNGLCNRYRSTRLSDPLAYHVTYVILILLILLISLFCSDRLLSVEFYLCIENPGLLSQNYLLI
jgi:H+/Cl- antiporter ClcA